MKLFGVIPMGKQWINISFPNTNEVRAFQMLDDGEGDLMRRWRHLITVTSTPSGQTCYADEVDVDAGWLTLPVFVWTYGYFLYRQVRWRRLMKKRLNMQDDKAVTLTCPQCGRQHAETIPSDM
jgi:hypothetical protein